MRANPYINALSYRVFQKRFRLSAEAKEFSHGENSFILYRIIGNSLPPRHDNKQTLDNLRHQLENEAQLDNCIKYWIVNRIFDSDVRNSVVSILKKHQQKYFEIPFDENEYATISIDQDRERVLELLENEDLSDFELVERAELAALRLKRLYIMNINGARNAAIEHGRSRAKWILPWDGNCFLTPMSWRKITDDVQTSSHIPYHIVPMARVVENQMLSNESSPPEAKEEPQVIFHRLSEDTFNENIPYGRRPKVEFLRRIGLWGPWERWQNDAWDVGQDNFMRLKYAYNVSSGWVYRLSSGRPQLEIGKNSDKQRMINRNQAILAAIHRIDNTIKRSENLAPRK